MVLSDEVEKNAFTTFNKNQDNAAIRAISTFPLGTASNDGLLDHQIGSILPSSVTEPPKTAFLHPAATSSSLNAKSKGFLGLPESTQKPWLTIFPRNVVPPALSTVIPPPGTRFGTTTQLAYCSNLLRKCLSSSSAATVTPEEPLGPAQREMIKQYAQSKDECNRICSMAQRAVEEFAADNLKTTALSSEVILLAPSLDKEYYRKLLNCVIAEFETARLLDIELLQGLVQLINSASSEYLESDDLVRILVVLRTHLQDTHMQSTKHSYYLIWGLASLLDVMVEGKFKDLRRIIDQEPLSALLNQLKDSNDPFLKHQATYAFQGLLHVPNDETRRQCMLRYSGNITMGLLGVASVCRLDLGQLKEGADRLYQAAGEVHEVGTKVIEGARSLFESGQGIWSGVNGGIFSGGRQLWYTSLREAQQHIRNGRLQDFENFVFEAPCRDDINFQLGVCRLLGGIAIDPLWETSTRRQAIDFLSELYKNEPIWTSHEDIYRWILGIIQSIVALEDSVISDYALLALQSLENTDDVAKQALYRETLAGSLCSYLIDSRLPIPTSSILLSRVLAIPAVEYDLLRLRDRRLKEHESTLYIQPQAKPSIQSSDDTLFPLMEKALEFLAGPRLVFLLLGDSGGGKSTFNLQLERTLWKTYKNGDPIPLHINLPSILNPQKDVITKQLQDLDFSDTQIIELKQNRQFIVICDGYDESQLTSNLHTSNNFNKPGQWKVKMIVSCRTQYLGSDYRDWFMPERNSVYDRPTLDLLQEAVIAPFNKEQIERYVDIYVPLEPRAWGTKDYMERLTTIPNLMDLVKNPFLLSLALEALPGVPKGKEDMTTMKITRVQLYDTFVQHWLEVNQRRLQRSNDAMPNEDRQILVQMKDAGIVSLGIEYSANLAQAIFDKQDGNPVVQYVHIKDKNTWKAEFFGPQAEVRLLRDSSLLTRTGNQYRFIHRSMLEYFFSRVIYNPIENDEESDPHCGTIPIASPLLDANGPLFQRDLLQEPSIIQFLCDRVRLNTGFEHQLRAVIDLSKTDANASVAATNAITILVRAGVSFNSADLRGIKIPGADLSNGQFDSAQFQGADLTRVNLSKSWLRQADMSDAHMEDVRFGELPYLEMDRPVNSCAYSPNGKMLGAGVDYVAYGVIFIYDTLTWTVVHRLKGHSRSVKSIAFSPDSQRLVSGGHGKTIEVWDTASGEEMLFMEGHSDYVNSVTISPCGTQIASASRDKTVQLWDAQTGQKQFVLEGHSDSVLSVKYSPDGCQLVSGSWDGTIRFWDARTGESRKVLSLSCDVMSCTAYSPDGQWVAADHWGGHLQLWDAVSLEPGPVLIGHTDLVTGIVFSHDGRWIASSSEDETVRLWDTSTGTVAAVLTGHCSPVECVAFSPDGRQIASGDSDCKVRLWEAGSSWSSIDPRNGNRVTRFGYSRDSRRIFSYDYNGTFRQWDTATGASTPLSFEMPEHSRISSRAFTLDGRQLAFGYYDGSIRLWDCQTGTAGPVLKGGSKWVERLVYSPCCRWIISVDSSHTVRLWDLYDAKLQPLLVDVGEDLFGVGPVTFSSTGGQFAVGTQRNFLHLFDTRSRECLSQLKVYDEICSLVFSPNEQQIAIGTMRGRIYLWDLQSKGPDTILEGHNSQVGCITYSPCGQWIASVSANRTVGIWHRQFSGEVESWSRMHSICAFFGYPYNLSWNPVIPMELVTIASDGSVQSWRISIGKDDQVVLKMVWGVNLGALCTENLKFTKTTGLNPLYQKLLIQRGAIPPPDKPTFSHC